MTTVRLCCAFAIVMLFAARADAAKCTVAVTSMQFGTYDVFVTAPTDSTGTVVLNCNGGAKNVAIFIDQGGASSFTGRRMQKGSESLFYNVYLDAGRTVIWGNGGGGSQMNVVRNPTNNQDVPVTMFGRIEQEQDVSGGAYTNTLTVTINY